MNDENSILGWVLGGVATVIATLAGVVTKFYKTQIEDYKNTEHGLRDEILELRHRADECESDRGQLRVQCARLEERIVKIEKKVDGN